MKTTKTAVTMFLGICAAAAMIAGGCASDASTSCGDKGACTDKASCSDKSSCTDSAAKKSGCCMDGAKKDAAAAK